jgi:hypothetical protein
MSTLVMLDNGAKSVKEIMCTRSGFEEVTCLLLSHPENLRSFTMAIDAKNVPMMKEIFILFSALCSYSRKGYYTAQLLLQEIKVILFQFSLFL